jgi:hypothetical protein
MNANNIWDAWVKQLFKKMSTLYHAKWQIIANLWALTKKATGMKTKLVRAGKNVAGTIVAGKALQELWVFNWWWQ